MQEEIVCAVWDGCMDQADGTEPLAQQINPPEPNDDINDDTGNTANPVPADATTQVQSVMTTSTLQNRGNRRAGY